MQPTTTWLDTPLDFRCVNLSPRAEPSSSRILFVVTSVVNFLESVTTRSNWGGDGDRSQGCTDPQGRTSGED